MLKKRLIPKLLIKRNERANGDFTCFITREYERQIPTGNARNQAKIFCDNLADEILFVNLDSDIHSNSLDYFHNVSKLVEDLKTPIAFGGSIRSLNQARVLIRSGIEKVILPLRDEKKSIQLCEEISAQFGKQAVQLSIDYSRHDKKILVRGFDHAMTELEFSNMISLVSKRQIGELHLFNTELDGKRTGFDLEMINIVKNVSSLPLVVSGGGGSPDDFVNAYLSGADGLGSGSYFARMDSTLLQLRSRIWNSKVNIRH